MRQTEPYRAVATPTPIVALRGRARCLITARTHEDPFICASRLLHEESRYGLLCALPGMSLTMFQKPPSDVRQLPRDAIVAMFELPPGCQGSSFIDNQPMI